MSVYAKNKTPRASMGCETPSRRCKPKDNLALDAMDALEAGMSYGKWKATHPETKAANESRLGKPPKRQYTETPRVYEYICRGCGKKFTTSQKMRRYCDDRCKHRKNEADYKAAHPKKTEEGQE